jgi:hypothetical protein
MDEQWDVRMLRTIGEGLSDAKQERIRTVNRVERGNVGDSVFGAAMIEHAKMEEDRFNSWLMEEYTRVIPVRVRTWAAGIPGLATGELFPRIIASIGNPRIAYPETWGEVDGKKTTVPAGPPFERSVRQLWSYCGCGDPDRRPEKNMTREELLACGKRKVVRPLLHTWSSILMRSSGRSEKARDSWWFAVMQKARGEGAGKVHERECRNRSFRPPYNGCGTVAHPEWGAIGSPWRPGHANQHAHRVVHKEFLRQLREVSGKT